MRTVCWILFSGDRDGTICVGMDGMRIDSGDEISWIRVSLNKLFPVSIFTETDDVAMMSSVSLTLAVKNESSPDIPLSYILPSLTGVKQ